jgi:hypothetical protein
MWAAFRWFSRKNPTLAFWLFLGFVAVAIGAARVLHAPSLVRALFYPPAMLFVAAIFALAILSISWRRGFPAGSLKMVVLFVVTVLIALRSYSIST